MGRTSGTVTVNFQKLSESKEAFKLNEVSYKKRKTGKFPR
jgi:hypothetical protein